jgi:hypothetical protein
MDEKKRMQSLLKDIKFRLKKLNDHPPQEQINPILEQIESDRLILQELAQALGGRVFEDFNIFTTDLQHYIQSPEDTTAYPQVQDDINILINQLEI